jgi:hypothetical protein
LDHLAKEEVMTFKITAEEKRLILRHRSLSKIEPGSWIVQRRSDANAYAYIMHSLKKGGFKVCVCDDDRYVAKFASTSGWYPGPEEITIAEVDKKCLQKIQKKLAPKGIKISAGVSPEQKAVVKRLRKLVKQLGLKCKFKSSGGNSTWVDVWIPGSLPGDDKAPHFPAKIRHKALDIVYGPDHKRDKKNPNSGNVNSNSIALFADQWEILLDELGM